MSKATGIEARLLEGELCFERATGIPGAFWYGTYGAVPDAMMHFSCPCGCGTIQYVLVRPFPGRQLHANTGTKQRPTINPSIGISRFGRDPDIEADGHHWHGHLRDGIWESCP